MTIFENLVNQAAQDSDDPRVQIGAVVTDKDGNVKGMGCNRLPYGISWKHVPLERKYFYISHAEEEAILEALITGRDIEGGIIHINAFPCDKCARIILKAHIKRVVVHNGPKVKPEWKPSQDAARLMFKLRGVEVVE